jgi:hypothetical protein
MIEFDEDLYPTDESIEVMVEELERAASKDIKQHKALARSYFDAFARACFYASAGPVLVEIRGEGMMVYEFHTGGWSGCETFIHAMKSPRAMVWMLYFERHDSGGHFYLDLATDEEKAPVLTERVIAAADGSVIARTNIPWMPQSPAERRRGPAPTPLLREASARSAVVFVAIVVVMLSIVIAVKLSGAL